MSEEILSLYHQIMEGLLDKVNFINKIKVLYNMNNIEF